MQIVQSVRNQRAHEISIKITHSKPSKRYSFTSAATQMVTRGDKEMLTDHKTRETDQCNTVSKRKRNYTILLMKKVDTVHLTIHTFNNRV